MNQLLNIPIDQQPVRNPNLVEGWQGTYLVDMGEAGRLRFRVHEGRFEELPAQGEADCYFACSQEDAMRFLDGSLNMLTALMQSRLSIEGDVALAQRLHGYIRWRALGEGDTNGR